MRFSNFATQFGTLLFYCAHQCTHCSVEYSIFSHQFFTGFARIPKDSFRKWKKKVEILFKGPLANGNDPVKCNYIIYWSGDVGMEIVDKWEIKGKIVDGNRKNINRYFKLFEEHIAPKSNALIAVVELKRLFQGSMSLEDFNTKALRLVKEAEYPEWDTRNRVLRDTIISGLVSDRIGAKIIKEGKDVTLPIVMENAQLEVSTQRHIGRM